MWIRSQNKRLVIEVNAFTVLFEKGKYCLIGYDTSNSNIELYWYLGKYSSEEKAIKVLDMIDSFKNEPIYNIVDSENGIVSYKEKTIQDYDRTFQMPQDSEVE